MISALVAFAGIGLVLLGARGSSNAANESRAAELHSAYFVANYSRLFVVVGALLLVAGGIVAVTNA
jgi:hypothetical protein